MFFLLMQGCGLFTGIADPGARVGVLVPTDTADADTAAVVPGDTDTGQAVEFDGTFSITSLTVEQLGPWIVVGMSLEPAVSVNTVLMTGELYNSGRQLAAWVEVVDGECWYNFEVPDACTQFANPVEYLTTEIGGDSSAAMFEQAAVLTYDYEQVVEVGSGGSEYIVECDPAGDWPKEWPVKVLFPGGSFELAGRGVLEHADGMTITLTEDFEIHELEFGTWTWTQDLVYNNPRQVWWQGY